MVTVSRWVNVWSVCLAAVMAAQAKPVARQNCFCRVRVMTIAAHDSFEVHTASQKSREFVVLFTHLAISVKNVRSVHCRKTHLIEEIVAGLKIPGQITPSGMTKPTVIERLRAGQGAGCRGAFLRFSLLPFDVRLERSMARFASNCRLSRSSVVAVGRFIVIFSHACVVASRAHAVPIHPTAGPVAPLAGLPIFSPIDVEPFVAARVVRSFKRLQPSIAKVHKKLP